MLEVNEQTLFTRALCPPEGYRLDRVVGTTYTLDLVAMLTVPMALSFPGWAEANKVEDASPLAQLESLRVHAERIHLFCDAAHIKEPPANRPLLAFLESSVFEVQAPKGGAFHPKVWVIRYVPLQQELPVRFKLLVLSRNLTFDSCWDLCLTLEGVLKDRSRAIRQQKPLAEFLESLPGLVVRNKPSKIVASAIQAMADELQVTSFELPEGFDELAFHPMGLSPGESWPFRANAQSTLVISPFLAGSRLEQLAGSKVSYLVSRAEELAGVSEESLAPYESFTLNDALSPEELDTPDGKPAGRLLQGLHAKLYLCERGWDAHVFVGSANATFSAFQRNVEFLVELVGKKSRVGIQPLMDGERANSLRSMLVPWRRPEAPGEEDEEAAEQKKLEKALDVLRKELGGLPWKATVTPDKKGLFRLTLQLRQKLKGEPPGVKFLCWPSSRPGEKRALQIGAIPTLAWDGCTCEQLTAFFVIEMTLSIRKKKTECSARQTFAFHVPLEGAPEDRAERILHRLLQTEGTLEQYLMMLLSPEEASSRGLVASQGLPQQFAASIPGHPSQAAPRLPLFETMLRSAYHAPEKLVAVGRLLSDLKKTPEGRQLIPDGLGAFWSSLSAVLREEQV